MELAAVAVPPAWHPGVLRDVAPAGGVRDRTHDERRQPRLPAYARQPGRTDRPPNERALESGHDALVRRGRGTRERLRAAAGSDDLAQDPPVSTVIALVPVLLLLA